MKYYLKNKKTGLYLQGYKGNKPLWADPFIPLSEQTLVTVSEEEAMKLVKRLECQSQIVELIEKKDNL